MKVPLHIAQKILQLMATGNSLPGSSMKHVSVNKMLDDGVLRKKQLSNTRFLVFLPEPALLQDYLHTHFGIPDLGRYIETLSGTEWNKATAISVAGDSKLKAVRSLDGFLVNVYEPITCSMQGRLFVLDPLPGCFTFVNDFRHFLIDPAVVVVGIENSENFSDISKQSYLFEGLQVLFVNRYPQSKDLISWLNAIENEYLHFGDLDFAGINIYLNEFRKHLGNRARFFIPPHTEGLLIKYGNRDLYNRQLSIRPVIPAGNEETSLNGLLALLHRERKVLEQEIFIGRPKAD